MLSKFNIRLHARVIGIMLLIEALFMLAPLITAIVFHEDDLIPFLISVAITSCLGLIMAYFSKPKNKSFARGEGFLLTALVWLALCLTGMLPFMTCSTRMSFVDGFFEATSGFTTTGVSVVKNIETLSHAILIWRSTMQWLGGMGIILFTLAVLPMLNSSGGMQMFNAEVTGIHHEKLLPRISSTAQRLWIIYASLTAALVLLYVLGPMNVFDSICTALSTISTGGYTTHNDGIDFWNSDYVLIVTIVFMFLGGVNFALIFKLVSRRWHEIWENQIFRTYILIIFVSFIIFDIILSFTPGVPHTIKAYAIDPLFHIVAMITSTGYVSEGFHYYNDFLLLFTLIIMFFGGCAGSTSGGAKLDRAYILFKDARNEIYRSIYPNHILSVRMNGRTLSPEIINKTLVFLGLYLIIILIGAAFISMEGYEPGESIMVAVSCMSNNGIPIGSDLMFSSYASFPTSGKWILSALMIIGRLEIFTILVLLLPSFWRK